MIGSEKSDDLMCPVPYFSTNEVTDRIAGVMKNRHEEKFERKSHF